MLSYDPCLPDPETRRLLVAAYWLQQQTTPQQLTMATGSCVNETGLAALVDMHLPTGTNVLTSQPHPLTSSEQRWVAPVVPDLFENPRAEIGWWSAVLYRDRKWASPLVVRRFETGWYASKEDHRPTMLRSRCDQGRLKPVVEAMGGHVFWHDHSLTGRYVTQLLLPFGVLHARFEDFEAYRRWLVGLVTHE